MSNGLPNPRSEPVARRHPFIWVVWFTALATIAVFAYAASLLLRDGGRTRSFGWSEESRGGIRYVATVDSTGPAAGRLQRGDRLISLNGDLHVALASTRAYRRTLSIDEAYQLRIARDGEQYEHMLVVVPGENRLALLVSYFVVSLVWCAVGLFIGFARPDQPLARLAFLAAIATGGVFLHVSILRLPVLWQPLHAVIGYHFFYRFPGRVPSARLWSALVLLLYAAGVIAAALGQPMNWAHLAQGASTHTRWMAEHPALLGFRGVLGLATFSAAVVAMIAVIARNFRLVTDADQRRRIRWVVLSSVVGLAPSVLFSALSAYELVVGPASVPWTPGGWTVFSLVVNSASVAIPISIAYAVVKHRVLDIKVALRLGVQYLLARRALQVLTGLPVMVLAITVVTKRDLTIAQLVTENTGYLFWIAAAGLGLRFRRPLSQWLDRKFFREQYDREEVLVGLLGDLGKLDSIEEVSRLASAQLEFALHPKALHVWYRNGNELALGYSSTDLPQGTPFPSGRQLVSLLEQRDAVVDAPFPPEAELSDGEARWLTELGVQLIVPITGSDDRLVGVLALGEKKSEEPYSPGDRRLLQAIAKQLAVVRENLQLKARVSEEQRIRHEVLERLDGSLVNLLKECPSCGACFDSAAESCDRDGQPLTLSLPVERTIGDRYRLEQLIGRGGMGAVYEAEDLRLARRVAIKIMIGHTFGQEQALRRFDREARAAARLNHPNIVTAFDYGALEGEGSYLVMERIYGVTLREEIEHVGALQAAVAADWFEQLLDGVAEAHTQGIVHRDLKPENVLGQQQDSGSLVVKILDFGLAKFRPLDSTVTATLTASGVVVGTFGYMSPEQLLGKDVDERTDIFALGVMLVEVLTGRRPFEGDTYGELLRTVLLDTYHLVGSAPEIRALDELLQRCLAKEPRDRLASVATLRRELIPVLHACAPLGPIPLGTS